MKKIISVILLGISVIMLSACFRYTNYPDMVEYSEDEVLQAVKTKYNVTNFIFTGCKFHGETTTDSNGNFTLKNYHSQFSHDFVNADNIETALTSFAGKNGGLDIQAIFADFLAYVALGKCSDNTYKYFYYNTNIKKDAKIEDTIGASDYTFDVLPDEINKEAFDIPSDWKSMKTYLNGIFHEISPESFTFSGNRLKYYQSFDSTRQIKEFEFYRENGKIVFDLYYTEDKKVNDQRRLVFSSSEEYGVIYNYYGIDKTKYFDVSFSVEEGPENSHTMLLNGQATLKEVPGESLYSCVIYRVTYMRNYGGSITEFSESEKLTDTTSINKSWSIVKIDGIDQVGTSSFAVTNFYIFYKNRR